MVNKVCIKDKLQVPCSVRKEAGPDQYHPEPSASRSCTSARSKGFVGDFLLATQVSRSRACSIYGCRRKLSHLCAGLAGPTWTRCDLRSTRNAWTRACLEQSLSVGLSCCPDASKNETRIKEILVDSCVLWSEERRVEWPARCGLSRFVWGVKLWHGVVLRVGRASRLVVLFGRRPTCWCGARRLGGTWPGWAVLVWLVFAWVLG